MEKLKKSFPYIYTSNAVILKYKLPSVEKQLCRYAPD